MNISSFFIERPIFATVLAILITVAGLLAMPNLPISEYPEIVPPTVVVSGQYPGASPKTIAETVITPLEQQINGVENAIYTNSTATPDGTFSITVTFRLGTDLDIAQVQTQNRVAQAETRLPDVVRQIGLVTQKRSPDLTMVVFLKSGDGRYDSLYLRNYAVIQIRDVLARIPGMGDVRVFGSGDYAMRLWLDPGKIAARSMDVDEVLAAVREQNANRRFRELNFNTSSMRKAGCKPSRSSAASSSKAVRTAKRLICAISRGLNSDLTTTHCAACWTAARRWPSRYSSFPARMRCSYPMACAPR
jgi:multidrug efflux pump subunit AcrB